MHGYTYTDVAAFHSIDKVFHSVRVSATSQKSGLLFLSLFFVFQMFVVGVNQLTGSSLGI